MELPLAVSPVSPEQGSRSTELPRDSRSGTIPDAVQAGKRVHAYYKRHIAGNDRPKGTTRAGKRRGQLGGGVLHHGLHDAQFVFITQPGTLPWPHSLAKWKPRLTGLPTQRRAMAVVNTRAGTRPLREAVMLDGPAA